jgi:endoglycosylceramidase
VLRGAGQSVRGVALGAAVAVLLLVAGAGLASAASLSKLHVGAGRQIRDTHGRQVLLRGVNDTSLADQYQVNPDLPTVTPLTQTDYDEMQALGFNVIRLAITWSTLEPERGQISSAYIARIRQVVDNAAAHGMYTILDMHNGGWGKYPATQPRETCPEGMKPSHGWLGAPRWATFTNGKTTCHDPRFEKRSPAVRAAWNNFWHNRVGPDWSDGRGIMDHLTWAWGKLGQAFANDPAVAGYDLMNEGDPGTLKTRQVVKADGRYYHHAIGAIRRGEKKSGGFQHLVLVEPNLTWSQKGLSNRSPKPGFSHDGNLVFSPHLYGRDVHTTDRRFKAVYRDLLRQERRVTHRARSYGSALWLGEWSFAIFDKGVMKKLRAHEKLQDSNQLGSAWWQWKLGCGAPQMFRGISPKPLYGVRGNLNPIWCPNGKPRPRPKGWVPIIGRAYPRNSPGKLKSLRAHGNHISLSGRSKCDRKHRHKKPGACKLNIWIPSYTRNGKPTKPRIRAHHVARVRAKSAPGGWVVTGTVGRRYKLRAH